MRPPLVYHPAYSVPLPEGHRFPMAKFRLLLEYLLRQGLTGPERIHRPLPAPRRWLERVHARRYHEALSRGTLTPAEVRRLGLPPSPALVRRSWLAAGGTHHAFADHGTGFCVFNDCAVAATVLLAERRVERLMVVDLDVHQGDGTATIFRDDPRVFTFSAHGAANFPLRKPPGDLDLALPDGLGDEDYLGAVGRRLPGLLARDRLVLEACLRRRIPVATVIGGGYDHLPALVERHALIVRAAAMAAARHRL